MFAHMITIQGPPDHRHLPSPATHTNKNTRQSLEPVRLRIYNRRLIYLHIGEFPFTIFSIKIVILQNFLIDLPNIFNIEIRQLMYPLQATNVYFTDVFTCMLSPT